MIATTVRDILHVNSKYSVEETILCCTCFHVHAKLSKSHRPFQDDIGKITIQI